jgi:hypothetical protein
MASPNTIMLKGKMQTRYEEARASVAITPGMLIENVSDGTVRPHTVRGGRSRKQFAVELYFAGGLVPGDVVNTPGGGIDSVYAINDLVRIKEATPTDVIYSLLKQGENVTKGDWLVSGGDGTMVKGASAVLQNIVADSATVTNTTAETTFSNGTVTVPANSLKVGDRLRVRQLVVFPATNATDTARIRMYLGATSLLDTGAVDVANGDNALLEVNLTIRTVGAGGTYVASGTWTLGTPGTSTLRSGFVNSTAIDTTVANAFTTTVTWSVANAGNQAILRQSAVEVIGAGTNVVSASGADGIVGQALESVDLSVADANGRLRIEIG